MNNGNGSTKHDGKHAPHWKKHICRTEHVPIQVQDDRTGMDIETLKRAFLDNLYYIQAKDKGWATAHDFFMALSYTVRDRLLHRWIKTVEQTYFQKDVKVVCYLSAEYLIGPQLSKNLTNVGMYEQARQVVREVTGLDLYDLLEQEDEPGLGNGGLGRLAACFLDSLSTLEIPAVGYGIRYEYGIFQQTIRNGTQVEVPDRWLRFGNPWEIPRPDYTMEVKFGGHTEAYTDERGRYQVRWIPQKTILGTPYDTPMVGYNSNTVNTLRLWSAKASEDFNLQIFNSGDFANAVADKVYSENITKVLYPNDNNYQGRELRLMQEYFFVSCSLQDIIRTYLRGHNNFDQFPNKFAIQINDTHPAIGIAELMRLLIDTHQLGWDEAWDITQKSFGFTNHTLLPEALERWPISVFGRLLPRHLEIIFEINQRFLDKVRSQYPGDDGKLSRLSLIEEGAEKQVRMAHLASVGSHAINGVAELHTELVKKNLFPDFYQVFPEKFSNKTNGVTPRRWILIANPKLALLIAEKIGKGWIKNLEELKQLEAFVEDAEFRHRWEQIKQENKQDLAEYILQTTGIHVDANSLFDIQVKRIHEYKRQHLNLLQTIAFYNSIKQNPNADFVPRTVIFAGKAAPGYAMAKLIIQLINSVANVVNSDPDIGDRLKVVFLENYNVSVAQRIYPSADLSEQISTAGKEASGTSNMKFAMNGALTIGTLDGANIEIRDRVGHENFFLFGLNAGEVVQQKAKGYNPWDYYNNNPQLRQAIDQIASGYFSKGDSNLFKPLVESLKNRDDYMLFADYQSYTECQQRVDNAYRDRDTWWRMSILNSSRTGYFSSDRTIREYARDIWHVQSVPVTLEDEQEENAAIQINTPLAKV
ncbi:MULTISPECIES: glycogen/starch/alpha-glucan phosphorylase [Nostocales]|uniref:Alpha-1,4 glucan phosphorylase n=2 Tax=Nostocales TaxID=1161 RepID=A0A8S9T4I4_9CYAN|nr:glycogen/starch/alpha-glucan phosphorylase [Tolypothrix bouteillei]KAF3886459.1 glycogen/starch/alpha-glucan phosphorylase [Tolypothrix bouteillei VB521301]